MTYVPYSCQSIDDADIAAVVTVLKSTHLTQGPAVTAFEAAFATRHQVAHAVAVSNATAGLHLGCLALGVGPASRVWTSPNSFLASANCALYCGATVDFVDIDPGTRNISIPELRRKLELAERDGSLPAVVIPVDFSGLPCDLAEIRELADRYGFRILEDAAHATGAVYRGVPVGSGYADATVFSFHPVKIITTAEGGIVTTRDEAIAGRLRLLRSHGMTRDASHFEAPSQGAWYYEQQLLGFNYRLTDMQAALGASQLTRLDALHRRRVDLANRYDELLSDLPLLLPARLPDRASAWHLYVVEVDESRTQSGRRAVFDALRSRGIGANVHYIPIHRQPFYRRLGFRDGDFPAAERYYHRAITIPLFPEMSDEQQSHVADSLRAALESPLAEGPG
jgi:UDP-4-amino-4,6-dideoxy-N-acetyl-beta-L-altrosamine transaminase